MTTRELDSLLAKLERINHEMGGDEAKKKKGKNSGDRFHELKAQVGERLHRLKFNLQDPEQQGKRKTHPREAIRRQQEIREDLRLLTQDIDELKTSYDNETKRKKKSKFSPEELQMRKEIIEQYASELAIVKDLASAGFRSPTSSSFKSEFALSSGFGVVSSDEFLSGNNGKSSGGPFGADSALGEDGEPLPQEEITHEHRITMQQIEANDQRFDQMIDEIGVGVQELGQLARGLHDELQQQSIMIDGLEQRIDSTTEHVENVNKKMKRTLEKVGRSGDKCMMDMICLVLLLGVLTVCYNTFIKKPNEP